MRIPMISGRRFAMARERCWPWVLLAGMFCWTPCAPAAGWSGTLEGGGEVTVDPRTNRATLNRSGVETQLWDGVHKLKDGSTIEVYSGQVIPNETILRSRRQPAAAPEQAAGVGMPIRGPSPCEKLVGRVCGTRQSCNRNPACGPARQLLDMETQERYASPDPGLMTYSSGKCVEADMDRDFFVSCDRATDDGKNLSPPRNRPAAAGAAPSAACELLVRRTCGSDGACTTDSGCRLARQLLEMAGAEHVADMPGDMPRSVPADNHCREALGDVAVFPRCSP